MQDRNRDATTKLAGAESVERSRRRQGPWRWVLTIATALLGLGMVGAGVALQKYSESDAFCGLACHRAMAPQHLGHRDGTHANVRCVECHIGDGALAHVVAKVRGVDQLWGMLRHDFARPVRMPYRDNEPMRPRCERCHDAAKLPEVHRIQSLRFGYDATSRAQSVSVTLRIATKPVNGTGQRGIGWHMQKPHQVSYVTLDPAVTEIPWVQVQHADGKVTTYVSRLSKTAPEDLAAMPRRHMDCTDCHNRVGHGLALPDAAIDRAMQNGTVSPTIPGLKRSLVDALWQSGKTRNSGEVVSAEDSIRNQVKQAYGATLIADSPLQKAAMDEAIALAVRLRAQALYEHLNVGWGTYADRVGHRFSSGCFRCHDGQHVSNTGEVLTNDCASSCHTAPTLRLEAPAEPVSAQGSAAGWHPYQLPISDLKIEGHERLLCVDCHGNGRAPARACEDCHHPPGI